MVIHSILVVDDDPLICNLITRNLGSAGYSVSSAGGAREALRDLDRKPVDLILTDLLMPDGDGFELIFALRKSYPDVRVIAMTGGGCVGADTYLTIARGIRVDGILHKPFMRDQLLEALEAAKERLSVPA